MVPVVVLSHPHYIVNFGNISYMHVHKCSVWVAFWCKLKKELRPSGLMWSRLRQGAQEGKISSKLFHAGEADVPGMSLREWVPWELADHLGRDMDFHGTYQGFWGNLIEISASYSLVCLRIAWGTWWEANVDSVCSGAWDSAFQTSSSSWLMVMLAVCGPHFESEGSRSQRDGKFLIVS